MAHPCPTCQKEVAHGRPENRHAPFCSGRCKTIDLGKWLTESYRVTAREVPDESQLMQAAAADPRRWS